MSKYNQPAMPMYDDKEDISYDGFTKLEQASLMIAPIFKDNLEGEWDYKDLAEESVKLAKAILEACEKESEV